MARKRLDSLVLELGLAESLPKAQAKILAGKIIVNDHRIDKPGTLVEETSQIRSRKEEPQFVSRGGLKLTAAIDKWPLEIKGKICIDVGASTGGFTDVLLQKGAKKVYAVDVGYNQLAYRIRKDSRVVVLERIHILQLDPILLPEIPEIAVIDVSFISLTKVLAKVKELLSPKGSIYALIKPQFEVDSQFIEKGGIVRDQHERQKAVSRVLEFAKSIGLSAEREIESPIRGADGNVEYLTLFKKL